jgi:hypothetical protein
MNVTTKILQLSFTGLEIYNTAFVYLFICGLFNNDANISHYILPNDRMIKLINNELKRSWYLSEGTEENHKKFKLKISGPRSEPQASKTQCSSSNQSTVTFRTTCSGSLLPDAKHALDVVPNGTSET